MPFNKKSTNEVKEQTLPAALGISEDRSDKISEEVHKLLFSVSEEVGGCRRLDNSKYLLALYDKYDDKELLYAIYVGVRMLDAHIMKPMQSRLMEDILKIITEK